MKRIAVISLHTQFFRAYNEKPESQIRRDSGLFFLLYFVYIIYTIFAYNNSHPACTEQGGYGKSWYVLIDSLTL